MYSEEWARTSISNEESMTRLTGNPQSNAVELLANVVTSLS